MLDLFFRKYAWTATLALLLAAAWLLARMVNTLVGVAIRPPPRVEVGSTASTAPRVAQPASLEVDRLYKLIGQQPPATAAETAGPPPSPQNCDDPNAAPTRSNTRIVLVAAVIADRPRDSLVTLTDSSSRETRVVGVGDEFAGARLLGLQRVHDEADTTGNGYRTVCLICNGGTKEFVEFSAAPVTASAGEAMPNLGVAPVPGPRGGGGEGVRVVSANKYEIERGVIDRTLSNMNTIATQARIVPSFKNGVANGFKLFSIQPGSLYSSIGIENGDVIQRINGYEINSPEKALELYQKLRESQQVSIELERAGQVIRKEYSITP